MFNRLTSAGNSRHSSDSFRLSGKGSEGGVSGRPVYSSFFFGSHGQERWPRTDLTEGKALYAVTLQCDH